MRKWNRGDKVVLTNGNRKLGEGIVKEEISSEDFTPCYLISRADIPGGDSIYCCRGDDLVTPEEWEADQPSMLATVTATRCEDGSIWVTSDLNQNGTETHFESVNEEIDARQFLIAITEFLGFDPDSVLCLPDCDGEFDPEDVK